MDVTELRISGLSKRFRRVPALDGLTLPVARGAVTAVIGPEGCGKSTLMRILAGFERADDGVVAVDGREIGRLAPHRRRFGILQAPDMLFERMTLLENVAFPLRMRGMRYPSRSAMAATALEMAGLADVASCRPGAVSPTIRQRTMLVRAAVFGPSLMLLDEPFAGLEGTEKSQALDWLRRTAGMHGSTVLLAARNPRDGLAAADYVAVLREGAIEQYGRPEAVFERPRNPFVAAYLGEINALPGVVVDIEDDVATVRLACGPVIEAWRDNAEQIAETAVKRRAGERVVPLTVGGACVVLLRPDRVAIAAMPASQMGEYAIDARLIETQFAGDCYWLRLVIGSGVPLIVRRPVAAGLRGIELGGALSVAWQPQHAMAFGSAR